ncbi:cysteine desulfurase family protein [Acinetobacter sp. BY484]|uniref:cysteine desulfurase family protein n=1 Tax=Acinetobacter sp. BY484 TaxID=2820674 RepID=UPI001C227719|nr:cysteine desulfurase family protein [Acinetobacter sp. BY484]
MVYLDFSASTPLLTSVKTELFRAFEEEYSNPSSIHKAGLASAEKIELSRFNIADTIGAYPSEIIFTSGASESNNLAIKGYALAHQHKGKHIITSGIEHKCVLSICNFLEQEHGYSITYIKPQKDGIVDADAVISAMREDTILVSIMHVNNELGTIQPIQKIGEACYQRNIKFHVDAAQSFKKIFINVDELNIDFLSISAHKIYGPKGIGALYIRDKREVKLQPLIHGAGQESNLRGGTLATPLILGFGVATTDQTLEENYIQIGLISSYLKNKIKELGWKLNSPEINTIPHIVNFTVPTLKTQIYIPNANVYCSNGSACSSLNIEVSHVLKAIGLSNDEGLSSIRVSLGINSKKEDIDMLIFSLKNFLN